MVRLASILVSYALLQVSVALAQDAQEVPEAPLLHFGAGMHFTVSQNFEFPTGASVRLWLLDQFGLEVDVFTREGNPTLTLRAFYKPFDAGIVSLYAGGGVAFFSNGLVFDSTLQATTGIDIDIGANLAFSAEIGGILGTSAAIPITAGIGLYYYF
ncbi:MAG TPA: hypothetical protein VIL47_02510 [Candidatus Bipolaricaulota bacterium]